MEVRIMKIIIEIETDNQNVSKIRKQLNESLENTMFNIIKKDVEDTIEKSHFTSDYFKSCKVTMCK